MQIYLIELKCPLESDKLLENTVFDIEAVKRQKDVKKREAMLCARALAMYALFKETGIKFKKEDFRKTDKGKPYVFGAENIHFNISHSENVIVCAVNDRPIGIDVQKITCRELVAKRFFTESERQLLSKNKEEEFTKIWTKKEALAKLSGEGMFGKSAELEYEFKMFRYKDFYITAAFETEM